MDLLALGIILFWLVAGAIVIGMFERFRAGVGRSLTGVQSSDQLPDALVILSLRGSDESLIQTLDGLAAQNYPSYQIHVVVDHPSDPANHIVREWYNRHPNTPITVEYLASPLRTCTLKVSAIHQVLSNVRRLPGAVVLVDGDADPYPNWLRDAVTPLSDSRIGAVTGNRWYLPRHGNIASWCRFIFAAFSLPTMEREGYAWGGTLAIRGELACSEPFLRLLAKRPTEEQTCYEAMQQTGLRLLFNPRLVQWNPESIELENLASFYFRQMMMARFYYPTWNHLLGGAIVTLSSFLASLILLMPAVAEPNLLWLGPTVAGIAFCAAIAAEIELLHRTLQQQVFARQQRTLPPIGTAELFRILLSLPVTLGAYCVAILRAHFATQAVWRRIRYWFHQDGIELDEYRPFVVATAEDRSSAPSGRYAT